MHLSSWTSQCCRLFSSSSSSTQTTATTTRTTTKTTKTIPEEDKEQQQVQVHHDQESSPTSPTTTTPFIQPLFSTRKLVTVPFWMDPPGETTTTATTKTTKTTTTLSSEQLPPSSSQNEEDVVTNTAIAELATTRLAAPVPSVSLQYAKQQQGQSPQQQQQEELQQEQEQEYDLKQHDSERMVTTTNNNNNQNLDTNNNNKHDQMWFQFQQEEDHSSFPISNSTTTTTTTMNHPYNSSSSSCQQEAIETLMHWLHHDVTWRTETLRLVNLPKQFAIIHEQSNHKVKLLNTNNNNKNNNNTTTTRTMTPNIPSNTTRTKTPTTIQESSTINNNQNNNNHHHSTEDVFYFNLLDPFYNRIQYDIDFRNKLQPALDAIQPLLLLLNQHSTTTTTTTTHSSLSSSSSSTSSSSTSSSTTSFAERYWLRKLQFPIIEQSWQNAQKQYKIKQELVQQLQQELMELQEQEEELKQEQQEPISMTTTTTKAKPTKTTMTMSSSSFPSNKKNNTSNPKRNNEESSSSLSLLLAAFRTFDNTQSAASTSSNNNNNNSSTITTPTTTTTTTTTNGMIDTNNNDDDGLPTPPPPPLQQVLEKKRFQLKKRQWQRMIQCKKQEFIKAQKKLNKVQKRLENCQEEYKQIKKQLKEMAVPKIFQQVTCIMTSPSVQDLTCHILAHYIRTIHAQLLQQYHTLNIQTDLTKPHEWFPKVRRQQGRCITKKPQRKIIFHAGPTNSGKTYQALIRLEQANYGMYYGPLRLLAAEIYERLTTKGILCNLDTGQEQKHVPYATHGAATIEMAHNVTKATFHVKPPPPTIPTFHHDEDEDDDDDDLEEDKYHGGTNSIHGDQDNKNNNKNNNNTKAQRTRRRRRRRHYDDDDKKDDDDDVDDIVVVIDEIQMIADPERGFAWTRALLGLDCNEIHVCGGIEAIDLIQKLVVNDCGDDFEIRTYQRFSPLQVQEKSLLTTTATTTLATTTPTPTTAAVEKANEMDKNKNSNSQKQKNAREMNANQGKKKKKKCNNNNKNDWNDQHMFVVDDKDNNNTDDNKNNVIEDVDITAADSSGQNQSEFPHHHHPPPPIWDEDSCSWVSPCPYADSVQPGDCVVAFTRKDIFAIKREIERLTPYRCCVVYGSLPPITRSQQAQLFNDPDSGHDVLVASDAIGMGLNLNIRRIIFHTIYKHDGSGITRLSHSEIKQIAGRAGRRNSPYPDGLVTCRLEEDLPYIRECMESEISPITKAGLMPMPEHLEAFSNTLETTGLMSNVNDPMDMDNDNDNKKNKEEESEDFVSSSSSSSSSPQHKNNLHHVLMCFGELASVEGDYFLGKSESMIKIAKLVADLDLTIRQKYLLCISPTMVSNRRSLNALRRYAWHISTQSGPLKLHDSSSLVPSPAESFDDLTNLCTIVNELDVFSWLLRRFINQDLTDTTTTCNELQQQEQLEEEEFALQLKEEAVQYINEALLEPDSLKLTHNYTESDRRTRKRFISANDQNPKDKHLMAKRSSSAVSSILEQQRQKQEEEEQQHNSNHGSSSSPKQQQQQQQRRGRERKQRQ